MNARRRMIPTRPDVEVTGIRGTYTALGYRSARIADKDGRSPTGGGNTLHEVVDRERLQWQSREFRRNNGIYAGMLRRAADYIVGNGFGLQCRTSDPAWNQATERAWARWWARPEVTGQLSGPRVEGMVADELLTCGESLVLLTTLGKLQIAEPEQLRGRSYMGDGIERDAFGAPTGYWIAPYDAKTGAVAASRARRYSPDAVLYLACPERPSSSRSVPPCQAAFPMLHRITDVLDSEAIAWQMQARVAILVNRQAGLPVPGAVARLDTDKSTTEAEGDLAGRWVTELDTAMIFHGEPGDDVRGMERTAPAQDFSASVRMFVRTLGLPLGLPLELLLLDWTQSNYSQSRAVLEQAFTAFRRWQLLLENGFHRRVFAWWLERGVVAGEIPPRDDMLEHEWITPTAPWIDQQAEAEAQGEKIDRGFTTFSAVCKSLGSDADTIREQLVRETVDAIRASETVLAETGKTVPWEQFAGKRATPAAAPARAASAVPAPADARTTRGNATTQASVLAGEGDQPTVVNVTVPVQIDVPERSVTVAAPVNVEVPERSVTVSAPVTIAEGAVSAPVTIERGAVDVDVTVEPGKDGPKVVRIERGPDLLIKQARIE